MPRATFACIHTTSISVKYVSCAAVVSSIIHDTWKLTQIRVSHVTRATRNLKTEKASSDTNRHTSHVYGKQIALNHFKTHPSPILQKESNSDVKLQLQTHNEAAKAQDNISTT
ncbi:hypothetical protein quinque_006905 [Culex quinquefasciatus]